MLVYYEVMIIKYRFDIWSQLNNYMSNRLHNIILYLQYRWQYYKCYVHVLLYIYTILSSLMGVSVLILVCTVLIN